MYPHVIDEFDTVKQLIAGKSIARFGDGEIKLIRNGNCVSQKNNRKCGEELAYILRSTDNQNCLTGIMNIAGGKSAKEWFWEKYHKKESLMSIYNPAKIYHSSFITRPDSAPWIDIPQYWQDVVKLWTGRHVLLVTGGRSSALRAETMPEAASVTTVDAPQTNAYDEIDSIEAHIMSLAGLYDTVIMCLGPTATCLAWRLSVRGIRALDLGHIAMYYRRRLNGEPMDAKNK